MAYGNLSGIALGAPNIYRAPSRRQRRVDPARMDVCAFVGVAPRGPCRVPMEPPFAEPNRAYVESHRQRSRSVAVAVESWTEYQRRFGGFEGPGRLPYAVASFFEQGGRRAYVVRIVHHYDDARDLEAVAQATLPGLNSSGSAPRLEAKNEGAWGNQLRAALGYSATPIQVSPDSSTTELIVDGDAQLPVGTLLRLTTVHASVAETQLRWVIEQGQRGRTGSPERERYARLDVALPHPPTMAEIIEADMVVEDGRGFQERFNRVGLSSDHPRWLAAVLYRESELVNPVDGWLDSRLLPEDIHAIPRDPLNELTHRPVLFGMDDNPKGEDRYGEIQHEDFFDRKWTLGDPEPGSGIQALTHLRDLSQVVVPDLYVPEPLPDKLPDLTPVSVASARFEPCVDIRVEAPEFTQLSPSLPGLALDPGFPDELEAIIGWQQDVVKLAETLGEFVVLLDVPPGLNQAEIAAWRAHFNTSYAAAYFPWLLQNNRQDSRDQLILLNPSAVAAGAIAAQEFAFGIPHGPANIIARNIVKVDEKISPQRHDALHPMGINIYLQQPLGVWLSAARTLSLDVRYRQLSVRRLMTMIRRTLEQQLQWLVFEPNHPDLWAELRHMLNNFLGRLYRQGAFRGASESEAFFVRCDETLNTRQTVDAGQLIAEIGVAPAEPMEFIVVRLTRGGDGTLGLEE